MMVEIVSIGGPEDSAHPRKVHISNGCGNSICGINFDGHLYASEDYAEFSRETSHGFCKRCANIKLHRMLIEEALNEN